MNTSPDFFFYKYIVSFLLLVESISYAGHGSSGGGNAREEMVRAIASRLAAFAQQNNSLIGTNVIGSGVHETDLLDSIEHHAFKQAINSIKLVFLNTADPLEWGGGRFVWDGETLKDIEANQPDRDAIYVASVRTIFFDQKKWDQLDELNKYLLVRKEYWRIFDKQDSENMRLFLVSFFDQFQDLQMGYGNTVKSCSFDGTINAFKPFEGYYDLYDQEDSDEFVTLYLAVDIKNGFIKINKVKPFWYMVGTESFNVQQGSTRHDQFFGLVARQDDLSNYKETLWVSGSTVFTKYWGNEFSYINFGCDSDGNLQLTVPRSRYRRAAQTFDVFAKYEKFEAGFATMRRTSVEKRRSDSVARVDNISKAIEKFVKDLYHSNLTASDVCKSFVDFGWGSPRVCIAETRPNDRFGKLLDVVEDQLIIFRSGILDSTKTYGPTRIGDRVYSLRSGRAIYSYNPVEIFEDMQIHETNQAKRCNKKNLEVICRFYFLTNALDMIEHNAENPSIYEWDDPSRVIAEYCGVNGGIIDKVCLGRTVHENSFWDAVVIYKKNSSSPQSHKVEDYLADEDEKWVELYVTGIEDPILVDFVNGEPVRISGTGFKAKLVKI